MKPQVFRSRLALAFGFVWLAFVLFNLVDIAIRGRNAEGLAASAVLLAITAVVYVTCLRPGIVAREDGVLVRNPLRTAFLPWRAIDEIAVAHAIVFKSGDLVVRSWTPQTSAKERAQAVRKGPEQSAELKPDAREAFRGRTHADYVAAQLEEMAEQRAGRSAETPATVSWAPTSVGAMAAAALLVILAIVLG
ncbi:PH domain-containing protein [Bailinhaonella thermotolerans]|uniref:PH domain-containing protein n=1 Tax=Bailinhaonella thermotolerans TaxID=1070861 RepID=UPI00192A4EF7|nr:PH domain-containing protein [Bailinhaonella thermotolerans]